MSFATSLGATLDGLGTHVSRIRRGPRHRWIEPYGAWFGSEGAVVRGRALSAADKPPARRDDTISRARRIWRRFETDELRGIEVVVRASGASGQGTTDEEGYFEVELPVVADRARAPFTELEVSIAEAAPVVVRASVPGATAARVMISDVDDTLLVANATDKVKQMVNLFVREADERVAVPGMADLLRDLARGGDDAREQHNPIAFVSSCPANVAMVVRDALSLNRFPEGPLFLPDVQVDHRRIGKPSHLEHKTACITRVLRDWPQLSGVLFGDTGQADPDVFDHVADVMPGRVGAVFLRDAPGGDVARADRAIERLARRGVPACRFADPSELRDDLLSRGWLLSRGAPSPSGS